MATLTGVLRIADNESRVNGTLLALCGEPGNSFSAATGLLGNKHLRDGDDVTVTGTPGRVGQVNVFCVQDASGS